MFIAWWRAQNSCETRQQSRHCWANSDSPARIFAPVNIWCTLFPWVALLYIPWGNSKGDVIYISKQAWDWLKRKRGCCSCSSVLIGRPLGRLFIHMITRISFIAKWLSFRNEVSSVFSWQNLTGSVKDVFAPDKSKLRGSFSETICMRHSPQTRGFIRSDEGLTLEKEALFLHGGNSTLCYRYQILMFHLSTDAAPQFL